MENRGRFSVFCHPGPPCLLPTTSACPCLAVCSCSDFLSPSMGLFNSFPDRRRFLRWFWTRSVSIAVHSEASCFCSLSSSHARINLSNLRVHSGSPTMLTFRSQASGLTEDHRSLVLPKWRESGLQRARDNEVVTCISPTAGKREGGRKLIILGSQLCLVNSLG